jgi:UTP--glucose-1-phosphate uridylyltransferase
MAAAVELRPTVAGYAFDEPRFDDLRRRVGTGELDPGSNRLSRAPAPLHEPPADLRANAIRPARRARLQAAGEAALREGKVAILVLNGGMATRFGGGAKGVVAVVEGHPELSFIAIKLADVRQRALGLDASIPVVFMHSFATEAVSRAHLDAIDWGCIAASDREWFSQSVTPRVLPDGTPLQDLPEAGDLDDAALYAAPGHGDAVGRLRQSGVLGRLRARGVEHILVSNVDNVGATLDPVVLGAHLEGSTGVTVEVVRRQTGDAGGCVAQLPDSDRAAIVEGFRLPEGTDLADYPHFNTNTLWLTTSAVDHDVPLTWFAVRKSIEWPQGSRAPEGELEVVQFERLIGQITEVVPTAFVEVDRDARFVPIKTREDLQRARPALERFARSAGLLDGSASYSAAEDA